MEIKIISQIDNGNLNEQTSIFEGERISYRYIHYYTASERSEKINDEMFSLMLGTDVNEEIPASEGKFFLHLTFFNSYLEVIGLIIKNSTIFITNKGQTIDKVIVN